MLAVITCMMSCFRYRNFRTFTSPRPTQFACLATDTSGELVAAGSEDSFEVFLWSVRTGRLLDVLAGEKRLLLQLARVTLSTSCKIINYALFSKY